MTDPLLSILTAVIYLPLYLTAFVAIGLVLRLRKTHPRACWYTVGAAVLMFLSWSLQLTFRYRFDDLSAWAEESGVGLTAAIFVLNLIEAALSTTTAILLLAAILTGRRSEP